MTRNVLRRSTRVTALGALVLLLAACSGSGETDTTLTEPLASPTTEDVTTEEVTTEPTPTETPTDITTDAATDMATDAAPEVATEEPETDTADAPTGDDVVAALEAAGLGSLATAVETASLDEQLANLPEFTVFAPSDDAFLSMGAELTNPEDIQSLLTYHVLDQRLTTSDLTPGENTVTTLEGSDLTVTVQDDGTVMVGDATVTEADVEVGDTGVIHVIDMVLQPTS